MFASCLPVDEAFVSRVNVYVGNIEGEVTLISNSGFADSIGSLVLKSNCWFLVFFRSHKRLGK